LGKTLLSEHTCGYKDGCGTARGGRANCARSPRATSCSRTGKAKALSPRTNRAGRAKADLLPADCKRHISRARRRVPARKASPGAASVKLYRTAELHRRVQVTAAKSRPRLPS
jgi:hypothetical protein